MDGLPLSDWKPYKVLSFFGEYEGANFSNPYTWISPENQNVARVKIKYDTPIEKLSLKGTFYGSRGSTLTRITGPTYRIISSPRSISPFQRFPSMPLLLMRMFRTARIFSTPFPLPLNIRYLIQAPISGQAALRSRISIRGSGAVFTEVMPNP